MILKIGSFIVVRESKAILNDLENQVTTETEQLEEFRRSWWRWGIVLAILGVILFAWGLMRAFG